jgi:hypothetical protein
MIKIDDLINKFDLNEFSFYKSEIFKPFIDCYFSLNQKHKYQLFQGYIFQYNKVSGFFKERLCFNESYCLPDGRLNLKLKKVKRDFVEHNIVYFIGYTYTQNPFFIRVNKLEYANGWNNYKIFYDFCGFMQGSTNNYYEYLTSDCKKINMKLQNLPILPIESKEWDPISNKQVESAICSLSTKTKEYVKSLK